jgi:xeroderma pigmentosum group C-complementing protein
MRHVRSKEAWYLQHARIVRESEIPAKKVVLPVMKKRPKKNDDDEVAMLDERLAIEKQTKIQPLYGEWQTDPFVAPPAVDGKVPKNKFGNVDLYIPDKMLPKGCTWLATLEAAAAARDLEVDFAAACVGMTFRGGAAVPNLYGIVVCDEFVPAITHRIRENRIRMAAEKKEAEEKLARKKKRVLQGLLSSGSLPQNHDLIFNTSAAANASSTQPPSHDLSISGDRFDSHSGIISALAENKDPKKETDETKNDGFESLFASN